MLAGEVPKLKSQPALETVTACNLCGGSTFEKCLQKRGWVTGYLFSIVRCTACGLRFVNPRLTEEANRELYSESYFKGAGFDATVNYMLLEKENQLRAGENGGIINKVRVLCPGNRIRVLDVGCGTGSLLRAFGDAGYSDIWGLEFSEYGANVARDKSGAKIIVADFIEADFGGASFEAINATEVLEHVRDPLAFLRKIEALLKPGGVFVYSTGNADGLYARLLGKRWPYYLPEGHLFYYTPRTLRRYFQRVGLQVVEDMPLPRAQRRALRRCADDITYSQLVYLGHSDPGLKGRVFRLASILGGLGLRRLVTNVVGKHLLPTAIRSKSGC